MKKILFFSVFILSAGIYGIEAKAAEPSGPKVENIQSIIRRVKVDKGAVPVRLFAQGRKVTVNVVTPDSPIKPHYHATHEEVIYIVKGHGKMTLADKTLEVKEGDIIYVPRKTLHSFTPEGGDCQMLSIFAPAFDGRDRVFLKENDSPR